MHLRRRFQSLLKRGTARMRSVKTLNRPPTLKSLLHKGVHLKDSTIKGRHDLTTMDLLRMLLVTPKGRSRHVHTLNHHHLTRLSMLKDRTTPFYALPIRTISHYCNPSIHKAHGAGKSTQPLYIVIGCIYPIFSNNPYYNGTTHRHERPLSIRDLCKGSTMTVLLMKLKEDSFTRAIMTNCLIAGIYRATDGLTCRRFCTTLTQAHSLLTCRNSTRTAQRLPREASSSTYQVSATNPNTNYSSLCDRSPTRPFH